ncbi:uncharacterized protein LOC131163394 [Malania oleifera]|uniref:uncharacterized protein LOC131163394 n=1 Tax=Malania oleifera TaxID=397392 RepID=UPI0025AE0183|nr:uncharacterized protein LOC131163394 [Malania oleifera]
MNVKFGRPRKVNGIWDQLSHADLAFSDEQSIQLFAAYRDRRQFLSFMMHIRDEFENTRASLLHRFPFPTLEKKAKDARDALKATTSSSSRPVVAVSANSLVSAPSSAPPLSSPSAADDPKMGQLVGTGCKVGRLFKLTSLHLPHSCSPSSLSAAMSSRKTLPFNESDYLSSAPFDLVHSNICGPAPVPTKDLSPDFSSNANHDNSSSDHFVSASLEPGSYDDHAVASILPESYDLDVRRSSRDLVDLPPGKIVVGNKWVYKQKTNFDGSEMDVKNAFLHDDLVEKFETKDLDSLRYFLDLEVSPTSDGFSLTQAKYASDLLTRAGITDSKITYSPLEPNIKLRPTDGELLPDGTYANWAGDPTDRRPTTGFLFLLGDSFISWRSKKQIVVARSSTKAEYRAIDDTTSELLWLRWLLHDIGVPQPSRIPLYCDNHSAV